MLVLFLKSWCEQWHFITTFSSEINIYSPSPLREMTRGCLLMYLLTTFSSLLASSKCYHSLFPIKIWKQATRVREDNLRPKT